MRGDTSSLWFTFLWLVVLSTFHVPVDHRYIFFGELSIKILCPFFKVEIAFVYNVLCFMCITLWFYICIHYSRSHQKFSFHSSPHNWLPLTISPSPHPFLYSTNILFFVSMCFFLFDLFINFFVCLYSTFEWNHVAFVFDLFFIYAYKRYYTLVFFSGKVFFLVLVLK